MRDIWILWHQLARVEIARHENATNAIVWNTECCICLSIAELECMRRQERAPDFASDTRVQFLRAVSHSSCSRYRCLWHWRRRRPRCQRQQSASVSAPPSQDMCEVCLIDQRDAPLAFVPCGHQRFCASCVAHLEQQARGYPICRSEITMVLRLY